MPLIELGPISFSGLTPPRIIGGPIREHYIVEHQVPGAEGGVVERLGSRQPRYQLQGFLAPLNSPGDSAIIILSGTAYIARNPDDAQSDLRKIGGSGAMLLRVESTYSQLSGYAINYLYDFVYINQVNLAYEAGKVYPYYPYTIDLHGATPKTYGNSSGDSDWTFGMSGYIRAWRLNITDARPRGEYINTLGVQFDAVTSGNAKLAIYDVVNALKAESTSHAITSGWNYFPIKPGFQAESGVTYKLAIKGDWLSGANQQDMKYYGGDTNTSGGEQFMSGISYSANFPATFSPSTDVSGRTFNIVMVTA